MAAKHHQFSPDQHRVTAVPKIVSDLPFFSLTHKKHEIPQIIKYEDIDETGRKVHWEVYPNTSHNIGAPGVEAHRVYHLLVKPSIDAVRDPATRRIPELIPLGGVRECLRKVGWTPGGHQGRELLKALTQIAFAGCVADFYMPTGRLSQDGKELFFSLKGHFSRMSVYAIGERHLTDEELATASFKFDLEDTIYIRLDALETRILETQEERFLDNEYLFSVGPAARRWYELMAAKIFGVIKHKGTHCDIRYSWYIKRHHTLKPFTSRRRLVEQMNRIVTEHLASGYLAQVEYFKIQEPNQPTDFIIRYHPGPAARESMHRVLSNIRTNAIPGHRRRSEPVRQKLTEAVAEAGLPSAYTQPDVLPDDQDALTQALTARFLVSPERAEQLVREKASSVRLQVQAFPFRDVSPRSLAGWMINAIERDYPPPEGFLKRQAEEELRIENGNKAKSRLAQEQEKRKQQMDEQSKAQARLDALEPSDYARLHHLVKQRILESSGSWLKNRSESDKLFQGMIRAGILAELDRSEQEQAFGGGE